MILIYPFRVKGKPQRKPNDILELDFPSSKSLRFLELALKYPFQRFCLILARVHFSQSGPNVQIKEESVNGLAQKLEDSALQFLHLEFQYDFKGKLNQRVIFREYSKGRGAQINFTDPGVIILSKVLEKQKNIVHLHLIFR